MQARGVLMGAGAVALAATILFAVPPVRADGTVSGKNTAAASVSEQTPLRNWPFDPLNETLLTATIQKGKRHRMVMIQATLDYNGLDATLLGIGVTVNGKGVEGPRSVMYCTNGLCDTVTGSWWLDLDAAESQYPGEFVNKPLVLRLIGGEITGGSTVELTDGVWYATLSAHMTKK